ncbi:MAG: DEAD/DEAH box helicase [Proteobacteria bacterium]|nr:DEAD/DEAH box helicase [Pseudomonadota bacterium]
MSDLQLLDEIENLELRALRWGFADGSLSENEVAEMASRIVGEDAADDALDALLRRRLLLEVWGPGDEIRIRSRFAETVRLLSRLRQLFPGRPWAGAPRLVSDYRLDLRRRRYPDRNLAASDVFARVGGAPTASFRSALWTALTGPDLKLADFQEEATQHLLEANGDNGLIVTAGTGSGKTMAFYLPALLRVAEAVQPGVAWTKALAIYPRTELLKDQFAETYRMARRLDPVLVAPRRPLTMGAYFGSTPGRADRDDIARRGWRSRQSHFVCPWLPCPRCGGDLLWRDEDIAAGLERLNCAASRCGGEIPGSEIVLTRASLARTPPDLLFTTTEMLNQRLSDLSARRLFGVGQPPSRRPIFALLDEVHTYTGVSGAQAALTLRRWRHAVAAPVTYVGLSATLREAGKFFADLTGLDVSRVREATPRRMVEEGAEYQILLRGDPASQTSLLSTSIQTVMLLARMLDPLAGGVSEGAFGSRLFAFTDNLDVINRLFDSLRDAEGLDIFGRPRAGAAPLAALRIRPVDITEQIRRERDGQVWRAVEGIGRRLDRPLLVGRTTSEDSGVLADSDVVVATASLEVGYNDSRVGAVLQHKAPKDAASFLQRRGRAGRARGMRPLTVTVLSDYGRDRIAFEAYEHLFEPELPPQRLPIDNDYVLRMQATFALFDWLSIETTATRGWAWDVLSRPPASENPSGGLLRTDAKRNLVRLLEGDPASVNSLSRHLRNALKIDDETVQKLLWTPPRALLLEAAPTLARRIHRDWRKAHGTSDRDWDLQVDWHPLPDFVARTLFTDLNLPEVEVVLPAATVRDVEKQRPMAIAPALTELAPGRVTRRFAIEHGGLHHWSPLDPDGGDQDIPIANYAEVAEFVGDFEADGQPVPVFRPWQIRLQHVSKHVAGPTSNARLDWRSGFVPQGESTDIELGARNPWREPIPQLSAFLHRYRSHVTLQRFAVGGDAVIRRLTGDRQIHYRFVGDDGAQAAIGFEIDVDALLAHLNLAEARLRVPNLSTELLAGCRLGYLRYRLLSDSQLSSEIDVFQRDWLHQSFVAAVLVRALTEQEDLTAAALAILAGPRAAEHLSEALRAIFQGQGVADHPAEAGDNEGGFAADNGVTGAQAQNLLDLFHRDDVRGRLRALAHEMTAPDREAFSDWILETVTATAAEALLQACVSLVPRHISSDSLVVDVEQDVPAKIWISETTLGGAGVLQAVFERVVDEPRVLFRALEAALAPTDYELAAEGLEAFVRLAATDQVIADALQLLRAATNYDDREASRERLYGLLSVRGLDVGHALSVSLNARILTPTSGVALDRLLVDLLDRWRAAETTAGVSIGVREIAFVLALDADIRGRVQVSTGLPQSLTPAEAAQVLANLLWPRGLEISQRALQSYNRYVNRRSTDPRLTRALLQRAGRRVSFGAPGWRDDLARSLAQEGAAELFGNAEDLAGLRAALLEALTTPIDVGFLQFFPKIERTERQANGLVIALVVQEQI